MSHVVALSPTILARPALLVKKLKSESSPYQSGDHLIHGERVVGGSLRVPRQVAGCPLPPPQPGALQQGRQRHLVYNATAEPPTWYSQPGALVYQPAGRT